MRVLLFFHIILFGISLQVRFIGNRNFDDLLSGSHILLVFKGFLENAVLRGEVISPQGRDPVKRCRY